MMFRNGGSILATTTLVVVLLRAIAAQEQEYPPLYTKVMGSCTFMNQWTGKTCMEFVGGGWTQEYMEERCGMEEEGVLDENGCPKPPETFAGSCFAPNSQGIVVTEEAGLAMEATAMMITPTSDCSFNAMACGSFMGGGFNPSPACSKGGDAEETAASSAPNEAPAMDGGGWGGSGGGQDTTSTNTSCDTSPGALTEALAKLLNERTETETMATATTRAMDDDHYSRVVDHTCIDSTGYTGKRCFYTYIPECATVDSPLVYDIHGVSLCPRWNFETSGWIQKAIDNCFVVVWPLGNTDPEMSAFSCFALEGGFDTTEVAFEHKSRFEIEDNAPNMEYQTEDCCCFNFRGPRVEPSVFDDLTFLRNVAAVAVDAVPERTDGAVTIDTKRIYMGGHSNGCASGLSMAASHSDMVAAVCCHSPALISPFPSAYEPVPIFLVHGKMDGTVPYDGQFPDGSDQPRYNPGAEEMNSLLGTLNGCTTASSEAGADSSETSNGEYTYHKQENCSDGNVDAPVRLLSLDTAGHTPFRDADLFQGDYDETIVTSVDTTQHAWDFCSGYSKSTAPVLELVTPPPADAAEDSSGNGDSATGADAPGETAEEPTMAQGVVDETTPDGPTRQDVIDEWKEENSEFAESSSSTHPVLGSCPLVSFLGLVSVATAVTAAL